MNQNHQRPSEERTVPTDERGTVPPAFTGEENWVHSECSELLILEVNCRDLFSRPPDAILPKSA